jgi:phenylacetate-CoA ligase
MDFNQLFFKYGVYYPCVLAQGQNVPAYLRLLRDTQWASTTWLEDFQSTKLEALLSYARAKVPYYQTALANLPIESGLSGRDLSALPFVTKTHLQEKESHLTEKKRIRRLFRKTTGGSTGQSITVWKTATAIAHEHAANWRGFEWAGIRIGDRQGRFWGVSHNRPNRLRSSFVDFVANRRRCSAFAFREEDMLAYTISLNRFRPRYLYGYVSMLAAYAEYLNASRNKLEFELRAVVPTSEVLTAYHRKLFEEAFGAKVFNEYGCGELGTIAHECERGSMHINAENLIVEILRNDRPCLPGEVGEIVVTELNNFAMPLIRYRLSDFGSFSSLPCPCGRTLPVIEKIFGRAYDLIRNSEGKVFHGEFFMYIFEEARRRNLGIRSFQVVQEDFKHFVIRVVPDDQYGPETERLVKDRIASGYSKNVEVNFVHVQEIPRELSGKIRLIVGMRSS